MTDLSVLETIARRAAAEGAAIHRRALGRVADVATKSSLTDMVTEVDRQAEQAIAAIIRAARPDDGIFAEEEVRLDGSSGVRWIVDPLDGTTNYIYGYPAFAVSIGIEIEGERAIGVVHDSSRDEVYVGVRGRGAYLDGRPIRPRAHDDLPTALVATGFLPSAEQRARLGRIAAHVLPRVRDLRRGGSAALDLCAVACGRIDAYYEIGLGAWDIAGGAAIAEAAGATVRLYDIPGGPTPLTVATNAALIEPFMALLREAGAL